MCLSETLRSDDFSNALAAAGFESMGFDPSADETFVPPWCLSASALVLDLTPPMELGDVLAWADTVGDIRPPVTVVAVDRNDTASVCAGVDAKQITEVVSKPFNPQVVAMRIRRLLQADRLRGRLGRWHDHWDRAQRIGRLGLWEWNLETNAIRISEGAGVLLALPGSDGTISLETLLQAIHPEDRSNAEREIMAAVRVGGAFSFDHRLADDEDASRLVLNAGEVSTTSEGTPQTVNGVVVDVTDRHLAERQVQQLSYFDRLTALPNGLMFRQLLSQEVARSRRSRHSLAVCWLDMNRFKEVNESVGHDVGDVVLKETAKRLVRRLRSHGNRGNRGNHGEETDEAPNVVARHGGDKFLVLLSSLSSLSSEDEARSIGQELIDEIARPFLLGDQELFLSASLGIATGAADGDDHGALMRRAETAMYYAKRMSSQRPQVYDPEMNESVVRRFDIETKLNRALEKNELSVFMQPLVDATSLDLVGAEALLRWTHPELGAVSPAEFVAVAEDSGLIHSIGLWALRKACEAATSWPEVEQRSLRLAVNLSSQQMRRPGFSERVVEILSDVGLAPDRLELEMTERIAMSQEGAVAGNLVRLRAKGIRIAIDDFGIGHSALSYMTRFPVDTLKIDRSFIRGIPNDAGSRAVTSAIAAMARSMGLRVVAEGVETREQVDFVIEQGCDELQGFLFSPAIDARAFADLVQNGSASFRSLRN